MPAAQKYDPLSLAARNMELLNGTAGPDDLRWNIVIALLMSVTFAILAVAGIKHMKKKL